MTYPEEPRDDEDLFGEEPYDEPPYPEGLSMAPLVAAVVIILTVYSWWLAYKAPSPTNTLLFGVAPVAIWCVGLRIIRKSRKRAEATEQATLSTALSKPIEDVPEHVDRYILGHEKVLFCSRRHPITLLGRKRPALGGLVTLVLIALAAGALRLHIPLAVIGLLALVLILFGYRFMHWWDEWVCVTNHRVMRTFGIVTRKVQMIPRAKIVDLDCDTPASANILAWLRFIGVAYGHIHVESAHDDPKEEGEDDRISDLKYMPSAANVSKILIRWG